MKHLKHLQSLAIVALGLAAGLAGCSLEGKNDIIAQHTLIAEVQYASDSSTWHLINDAGETLWVKNAYNAKEKPRNGARVIAAFNVFYSEQKQGFDYVVECLQYAYIDVLDVVCTVADSISVAPHNNLKDISEAWVSNRYLNVSYTYYYDSKPEEHAASLLCDTVMQKGMLFLYLKHESKGSSNTRYANSVVSFNLESLRSAVQQDSITMYFEVKCENKAYTKTMTYRFKP